MKYDEAIIGEVKLIYEKIKSVIEGRIREFESVYQEGDERIFAEMAFCILTPQSKARVCWEAVKSLMKNGDLYNAPEDRIMMHLKGVRFYKTKAKRIVDARKKFYIDGKWTLKKTIENFDDVFKLRNWLVKNVNGYGYKEASHFLRNIGKGDDMAILDRHILKNLKNLGVIEEIPKSMTKKKYFEIEEKMREFCSDIGIPMSHMDLVLWFKETGDVFK